MRVRYIVLISLVFFASVIGIWFLNYRGHLYPAALGAPDGPGTFGDSFGSINALFAGLAFAGIAVSIFIQADQLRVSRKEMIAAQDTLRATSANLEKQNAASSKQMFEFTFFNLLNNFSELVKSIEAQPPKESKHIYLKKQYSGQESSELYLKVLQNNFIERADDLARDRIQAGKLALGQHFYSPLALLSSEDKMAAFTLASGDLFNEYGDDIGRYFRTLYTLMKFIKVSRPEGRQKFYFKLIRAQLSSHEATMLALNALSPYSTSKFNSLISEFGMLKNATIDNPVLVQLIKHIDPRAFGRQNVNFTETYYLPENFDGEFKVRYDKSLAFDE